MTPHLNLLLKLHLSGPSVTQKTNFLVNIFLGNSDEGADHAGEQKDEEDNKQNLGWYTLNKVKKNNLKVTGYPEFFFFFFRIGDIKTTLFSYETCILRPP